MTQSQTVPARPCRAANASAVEVRGRIRARRAGIAGGTGASCVGSGRRVVELHPVSTTSHRLREAVVRLPDEIEKPYSRPGSPAATPTDIRRVQHLFVGLQARARDPLTDAPRHDERAREVGVRHQQQHAIARVLNGVVGVAEGTSNRQRG